MAKEFRPDFKAPARIKDREAGWEKVAAEGRCRACGRRPNNNSGADCLQRFHLVGKGVGGDDVDDNIIPACTRCHDDWHAGGVRKQRVGNRLRRGKLRPNETGYVIRKRGLDYYLEMFPALIGEPLEASNRKRP